MHGALVLLDDDGPMRLAAWNDKRQAGRGLQSFYCIPPCADESARLGRLRLIEGYVKERLEEWLPDVVALEDYAFAAPQGAHQLGELGGLLRLAVKEAGIAQRWYAPKSVKMFTCHNGNARKDEMIVAVKERWPMRGDFHNAILSDICDARAIAAMISWEARRRANTNWTSYGSSPLDSELTSVKERQVFFGKKIGDGYLDKPYVI